MEGQIRVDNARNKSTGTSAEYGDTSMDCTVQTSKECSPRGKPQKRVHIQAHPNEQRGTVRQNANGTSWVV